MTSSPGPRVLDAYALLAFFKDEPAAERVQELLEGPDELSLSVINLGEVFYKTVRSHGLDRALQVLSLIDNYPIDVHDADRELALNAALHKSQHKMSYADGFVAALAERLGATIVTGDPDFLPLEGRVTVEWLPAPSA